MSANTASMITPCPSCGRDLEIEAEWLGRKGQCPYCEESFIIPENVEPPVDVASVASPERPPVPSQAGAAPPAPAGGLSGAPKPEATDIAATKPMVTAKIGELCPQCGCGKASKQFGAVHWVLAIVLFPVGLLAFLLPRKKCKSCGCVFHRNWLKPAPADGVSATSEPAPTCWYCETVASSPRLNEALPFHRGLDETEVCIPRCEVCQSIRTARSRPAWVGLGIGALVALMFGGSEGVGTVLFVGAVLGVIGWLMGRAIGKSAAHARAAATGLEIKQEKAWELYPPVRELQQDGWTLGDASEERKRRLKKATTPPDKCPVCNSHTGKVGTLRSTLNLTVADQNITVAERCRACGQWGCRLCMHFHGQDNQVIWKGVGEQVDEAHERVYKDPKWKHNACCGCGFGVVDGRSVVME